MDGAGCTYIFRNVYMYTYMHLATANEKEATSSKERGRGIWEGLDRERSHIVLISKLEKENKRRPSVPISTYRRLNLLGKRCIRVLSFYQCVQLKYGREIQGQTH